VLQRRSPCEPEAATLYLQAIANALVHGSKSRRHRQRGGGADAGLSLASLVLGGGGGGGGGAGAAKSSAEAEAVAEVGGERVVARCPFCGPAGLKYRLSDG